jgi:phosphoglycerol transferase MdoB-like AlkP superfamily enzyme
MIRPGSGFLSDSLTDLRREIRDSLPEKKMNVVLISVESLSASFMKAFGNTNNITPQLDSLADKSLFFTNMYAAGTRTVRGLEALTLSIPPLPGESIVKRPGNENMFSIGSIFKSKGYTTQFMYGGYGYFDNMNYFFGNNGYQVIDRTALQPGQIHYANIWGVADEDLFTLAIKTLDSDYQAGKPFFTHIMTVSNHRPYTYPDGRIDIPPSSQTRNGAVKYTDYAIGKFIKEAAAKPWFANTVFVIVADHCASSAGKEELPVAGYHIPLIMYSPANIPPQRVDALTSQIDVPPTILGLLHFNYTTKFYGHDIFKTPAAQRRVFISTYQGLGYLQSDTLIVQTPVKKIKAYKIDPVTSAATEIDLPKALSDEAISFYQSAAWLIQQKKYNALHQ